MAIVLGGGKVEHESDHERERYECGYDVCGDDMSHDRSYYTVFDEFGSLFLHTIACYLAALPGVVSGVQYSHDGSGNNC